MERIILVRHGQTNKNIEGRIHSENDEEYLNHIGIEQLKKTAEKLKEFSPVQIYSSKGERALESGKILSNKLTVTLTAVDGIQERNWGDFSGKLWAEVLKILEPMNLEERYLYTPPNGESWKIFEARLINAITEMFSQNKGQTFVVVSHGGSIRALMPYLLGKSGDESFKYNIDNASITAFEHKDCKFTPLLVNDTTHLK